MSEAQLSDEERVSLADALRAEHAAVYAYGVVAAYASPQRDRLLTEAGEAHRGRRDALTTLLRTQGADVPAGEAAYTIPFPVTDEVGAAVLGALVEDQTAIAWRSVLERSDPGDLRRTALDALTDCAVRATGWRTALGQLPPVATFPGQL